MVLCSEPEKNDTDDTFVGKLLPERSSAKVNRSQPESTGQPIPFRAPEMVCHNLFAMPSSVVRRRTSARASYRTSKALCFLLVLFFQAPMQLRRNDAPTVASTSYQIWNSLLWKFHQFSCKKLCDHVRLQSFFIAPSGT